MTSPSQLAANTTNAQKSTGPKSEPDMLRTRLNAYKHSLTRQIRIVTNEEQQSFEQPCIGILESLAPVGALELDLAQSIANGRRRLTRARAIERGIFALGQSAEPGDDLGKLQIGEAVKQARAWIEDGKGVQFLALYERRIKRAVEMNMAQLRVLRAEREAARSGAGLLAGRRA